MSRKRRNRSENTEKIVTLDLSSGNNTEQPLAVEPAVNNEKATAGVFTYLKNHLWVVGIIAFLTLGALGSALKYLDEDAQREIARRTNNKSYLNKPDESFLNKVNPFLPAPLPTPTPQLSKEYLYAGSRLLSVVDANANEAPPSDLAIWRPSSGDWWVMAGTGTVQVTQSWGSNGDIPVPGDYDGDGKTDFAVWRPVFTTSPAVNKGTWYIINSAGGSGQFDFGLSTDVPVPADYDGDGKTDVAVFRNSNTTWYINYSSNQSNVYSSYGSSGDTPSPADFDGDGKADLAVFRTTSFYYLKSSDLQSVTTSSFGASGDKPVCGDYDGDGKADIALWRSSNATWYIKQSSDNSTQTVAFGIGTDKPVQNDYDGDGKVDIALWRAVASTSPGGDVGKWYIRNSSNTSTTRVETWGIANDIPVPAFWKRQ